MELLSCGVYAGHGGQRTSFLAKSLDHLGTLGTLMFLGQLAQSFAENT